MSLIQEDKNIKTKLEQDFPFNQVDIKQVPQTKERVIFFDGFNSGFSYSLDDLETLEERGQSNYAEKVFYENLREIMLSYFMAQGGE